MTNARIVRVGDHTPEGPFPTPAETATFERADELVRECERLASRYVHAATKIRRATRTKCFACLAEAAVYVAKLDAQADRLSYNLNLAVKDARPEETMR